MRFIGLDYAGDPKDGCALPIYALDPNSDELRLMRGPIPPDARSLREVARWRKEQERAAGRVKR